jgi:hypothetical protein
LHLPLYARKRKPGISEKFKMMSSVLILLFIVEVKTVFTGPFLG